MRPRMLSRRELLASAAAASLVPAAARATSSRPKRFILVFADGGWDTSFLLDPKFSSPDVDGPWIDEDKTNPDDEEYEARYGDYSVVLNDFKRPTVSTFFRDWGTSCSVINGVWTGAIAHDTARVRILTGTQSSRSPDAVTIIGSELGRDLPLGSIDLSGISYSGHLAASTGQVGFQSQIATILDPNGSAFAAPAGTGAPFPLYVPDPTDNTALRAYMRERAEAFGARYPDGGRNDRLLADRLESMTRAERVVAEGTEVLGGLAAGNRPSLNLQLSLGVELLSKNLCTSIMVETTEFWDSHDNNTAQHEFYEGTFRGMNLLAELLQAQDMLDDTLVILMSEMTRTPRLNARNGKDHWPHVSALLFGAGFTKGRRFGGSSEVLESQAMDLNSGELTESGDLCKYDNLNAGILEAMGVDPAPWFPDVPPFRGWIG